MFIVLEVTKTTWWTTALAQTCTDVNFTVARMFFTTLMDECAGAGTDTYKREFYYGYIFFSSYHTTEWLLVIFYTHQPYKKKDRKFSKSKYSSWCRLTFQYLTFSHLKIFIWCFQASCRCGHRHRAMETRLLICPSIHYKCTIWGHCGRDGSQPIWGQCGEWGIKRVRM